MLIDSLVQNQDAFFVQFIRTRLKTLRNMLQEEDGTDVDLDMASVSAFVAFLRSVSGLRLPGISLTPEGEVYARWKGDGPRLFALHFISGEKVRFVAFRPNPRRPRLVQRISGIDAVDTVMEFVNNALCINQWVLK